MTVQNPYESHFVPESEHLPDRTSVKKGGLVIPIALGTFSGGICALPFLVIYSENLAGFLTLIPGSLLGGLYVRWRTRNMPLRTELRQTRYLLALVWLLVPPFGIAIVTGMRSQGLAMTILAAIIGIGIGFGIVASGDRRPETVA